MSLENPTLDDVFNDTEAEVEEIQPEVEDVTADDGATAAPEESEDAGQPETVSEKPEVETEKDKPHWSETAYMDEKRKRQELERRLEAMQRPEPEKAPDIFESQEGYDRYIDQKLQRARLEDRVTMSQELMRMQHEDYDQKEEVFVELMANDPTLQQRMLSHPMPAKFVMDTVAKHEKMQALENVDQYEAKVRADLEQKIRAELEAEYSSKAEKGEMVSKIKPSLASARSTGKVSDVNYDASLNELLGR